MRFRARLFAFVLTLAAGARAETPTDATARAREHFQSGILQAQQGNLVAALREFETAYSVRPHFSVLYNIAQTNSTLGRPVQAVAAFERYLTEGAAQISEERSNEVKSLLAANRQRVGRLRVVLEPGATARVWLDGSELEGERLGVDLPVALGEHSLVYAGEGRPAQSRSVVVSPTETAEVRITAAPPSSNRLAQLGVACEVPDVAVEVVGLLRAKTPLKVPLLVPEGRVTVRFSRPGYTPVTRTVDVPRAGIANVDCAQRPVAALPPALQARFAVSAQPFGGVVTVDGERMRGDTLPVGRHWLRVEHDGFVPHEQSIELQAGRVGAYQVTLLPTPAQRERERSARRTRKTAGVVTGAIGMALLGGGVGVYVWNSNRYEDWRDQGDAGAASRAASIQRGDDGAIGLVS